MGILDTYRYHIEELHKSPQSDVPYIAPETVVGHEYYTQVIQYEQTVLTTMTHIRNIDVVYTTTSKRLLWQAIGLEYIESELLDFIDAIPHGEIYMDIGASNGIFAMYAAVFGKCTVSSQRLPILHCSI